MTKEELEDVIYDAQKGAMGCGCCASTYDERNERKEAVSIIWEVIQKAKQENE